MFFVNIGGRGYEGIPMNVSTSKDELITPILGFVFDPTSISELPSGLRRSPSR